MAFLDSDDVLGRETLSASVAALDAHPDAGLTLSDYESIDAEGRQIQASVHVDYPALAALVSQTAAAETWQLITQPQFAYALLFENFISTSGLVVRRQLLEQVGPFDESLGYSEDRDMWFRLAHQSGALYRRQCGLSRRLRAGSLSFGSQARNASDRITVLRRERERWQERAALRQIDRRIARETWASSATRSASAAACMRSRCSRAPTRLRPSCAGCVACSVRSCPSAGGRASDTDAAAAAHAASARS